MNSLSTPAEQTREQTVNPYVGPRTFTEREGRFFFGREREARDLTARIVSERLLLFYAQSGAGKSSLINTRIIPKLRDEERFQVLPVGRVSGAAPAHAAALDNIYAYNLMASLDRGDDQPARLSKVTLSDFLARLSRETVIDAAGQRSWRWLYKPELAIERPPAAAADGSARFVLIIDQFEEIITSHPARWREREDFFRQLNQALLDDPNLWVVLTLREDYVAALDPYAELTFNRLRARVYMQRMDTAAALDAIRKPAELAGRAFADGVAEQLVDNLRQVRVPGQQSTVAGQYVEPVQLQVVCYQLWQNIQHRPPGLITASDLLEAGDVDRALTQFYEESLAAVLTDPTAAEVSERQLRTWFDDELITEAGTRGLVHQDADSTGGLPNGVVAALQRRFLVRAEARGGDAWIELVHDRLVEPVRASNAAWFPMHLSALQRQAALWEEQGRSDGLLVSGEALVEAEQWASMHTEPLEAHEQDFLAACQEVRRKANQEQQQSQRIKILAAAATLGLLIALALAVVAIFSLGEVEQQKKLAHANQLLAQAQTAAERYPQRALLLEVEALREALDAGEDSFVEGELALRTSLAVMAGGEPLLDQQLEPVSWAISPDKKWFVAGGGDHPLLVWNLQVTDSKPVSLTGSIEGNPESSPFSPDSRWLSSDSDEGAANLWDLQASQSLSHSLGSFIYGPDSFSPDARWLVSGVDEDTVLLWDLTASEPVSHSLDGANFNYYPPSFSPDARWLVSGVDEDTVLLWDLTALEPVSHSLDGASFNYGPPSFSPDARWLVSDVDEDTVLLWDLTASEPVSHSLDGASFNYGPTSFSQDSDWLVSGVGENTALLWDLTASEPISYTLDGASFIYGAPSFSPDSDWLVSGTGEDTALLWDLQASEPVSHSLDGAIYNYDRPPFSPDSRWLVGSDAQGITILWDLQSLNTAPQKLSECDAATSITYSTNIRWLACNDQRGNAFAWDLTASAHEPKRLQGDDSLLGKLHFSPNEFWLVALRNDHGLNVWTIEDEPTLHILRGHDSDVGKVVFLEDQHTLITISKDGELRRWDLQQPPAGPTRLDGHDEPIAALAADAVGRIISLGSQGELFRWDMQQSGARPEEISDFGGGYWYGTDSYRPLDVLSPDGRWFASGSSWSPLMSLQDFTSSQLCRESLGPGGFPPVQFFSPDGHWLASIGDNETSVSICDVTSEQDDSIPTMVQLNGMSSSLNQTDTPSQWALSSDARWLARGNPDGTVEVWDIESQPVRSHAVRSLAKEPITQMSFRNQDALLAVATENKVSLWDVQENTDPDVLTPKAKVTSISFDPEGLYLAAGNTDGRVHVWDMRALDADPHVWRLPKTKINALTFIPNDGSWSRLAAGGEDNVIYIIDRQSQDQDVPLKEACDLVGRNLTQAEWLKFMPEDVRYRATCENWPAHPSVIDELLDEGNTLAYSGDIEGAVAKFEEALRLDPDPEIEPEVEAKRIYASALVEEGRSLVAEGEMAEAVTTFREALSLTSSIGMPPPVYIKVFCAVRPNPTQAKVVDTFCSKIEVLVSPITVGETVTGTVESNDIDLWSFDTIASITVTIDLMSDNSELDAYLYLYAPDGSTVAENDDYTDFDSHIETILPMAGRYIISAGGFDDSDGAYQLKLTKGSTEP
jgi:WD40 repeat protein